MATRIRLRYDDRSVWDTQDPELLPGEFAVAKETDGTITVRVGIERIESSTPITWSTAPEISTSGVPGGNIDFTDLQPGEVLYWDGTQWYGRGLDELIGGGNKISVSRNTDGTININYFESTFDVSFGSAGSAPTEEVFNNNNSFPITGVTARATLISANSTVGVDTVTAQATTRFTSSVGLPLTSASSVDGTTAETSSFILTPTAVSTWFGVGSQSATLTAFATSRTTDDDGNTIPPITDPLSGFATALSKKYRWKVFGFTSNAVLDAATISNIFSTNTPDSKNTLYQNSALSVPTGLYDLANNSALSVYWAFNQPTIQGSNDQFRYLYLLISSQDNANETNELYGWSNGVPRAFIPVDATVPESGFLPIDSTSNHVDYVSSGKNYSYKAFTVIGIPYSAQTGLNYVSAKIDVKPS